MGRGRLFVDSLYFFFVHSLERMCLWHPAWHLCQNETETSQHRVPRSILLWLETKTLLQLSGATNNTQRQDGILF